MEERADDDVRAERGSGELPRPHGEHDEQEGAAGCNHAHVLGASGRPKQPQYLQLRRSAPGGADFSMRLTIFGANIW